MKKPISSTTVARLAVVVLFFTAAPTVGDIGSCGQAPDDLDPVKFFTAKEALDCQKCLECEILVPGADAGVDGGGGATAAVSLACVRACEPALDQSDFPRGCYPLVHDGEVCLHALQASGCGDYRRFMSDVAPTIPTECNFCPPCNDGGLPDGFEGLPACE